MAENIIMPQLGESIAEGTIVKWLKSPGDSVKKDENVLLISTDKVEAEIPSPCDGVLLNIDVNEGETVQVGTVLGKVGQKGEQVASSPAQKPETKEEPKKDEPLPKAPPPSKPVEASPLKQEPAPLQKASHNEKNLSGFYSPLVKKIAQEKSVSDIELRSIKGTGLSGRVSKKDLLSYLENRPTEASDGLSFSPSPLPPAPKGASIDFGGAKEVQKDISSMRKVIMENMVRSRQTSAHVTTFFEIDYTNIDLIRQKHKNAFKTQEGVSLTYTTFLAAAVCQVLKRHPYINASVGEKHITFKKAIHLGIAVAIEQPEPGLMVPVIKNADMQNLRGLAHTIADISSKVRNRKIMPDELSGGTFTITNPGNYGAIIGTPIINQPQVAILGVGQIKKTVRVLTVNGSDTIAIRNTGLLSLSFDHRLIDGATADIFMADLKHTLETWKSEP